MKSNQTTLSSFTVFGTPERAIVDGRQFNNKHIVAALLLNIASNPQDIKAFAIIRIAGIVTLYIKTAEAAK